MSGFYEDDEPVEKVAAAFERGEKGVTGRPVPLPKVPPDWIPKAIAVVAVAVGAIGVVCVSLGGLIGLFHIAVGVVLFVGARLALGVNRELRANNERLRVLVSEADKTAAMAREARDV